MSLTQVIFLVIVYSTRPASPPVSERVKPYAETIQTFGSKEKIPLTQAFKFAIVFNLQHQSKRQISFSHLSIQSQYSHFGVLSI